MAIAGAVGMLLPDDDPTRCMAWRCSCSNQWGSRIGGGTDQVQRNIIGERVLGLPGEPRPDKNVPFRELPK